MGIKTESRYLRSIVNQANRARAWFFCSLVFLFAFCFVTYQLVDVTQNTPVRLIPYNFHTAEGIVEIRKDGYEANHYIASMAYGDIKLFTDWSNKSVVTQFKRFINRMHPSLRGMQEATLLAEADRLSNANETQFLTLNANPKSRNGNEVILEGTINRFEEGTHIADQGMRYRVFYEYVNGIPFIKSFKAEPIGKDNDE